MSPYNWKEQEDFEDVEYYEIDSMLNLILYAAAAVSFVIIAGTFLGII